LRSLRQTPRRKSEIITQRCRAFSMFTVASLSPPPSSSPQPLFPALRLTCEIGARPGNFNGWGRFFRSPDFQPAAPRLHSTLFCARLRGSGRSRAGRSARRSPKCLVFASSKSQTHSFPFTVPWLTLDISLLFCNSAHTPYTPSLCIPAAPPIIVPPPLCHAIL